MGMSFCVGEKYYSLKALGKKRNRIVWPADREENLEDDENKIFFG